jgi:hypothetical protein
MTLISGCRRRLFRMRSRLRLVKLFNLLRGRWIVQFMKQPDQYRHSLKRKWKRIDYEAVIDTASEPTKPTPREPEPETATSS